MLELNNIASHSARAQSGSLIAIIPALLIIFVVGIGAFGMDVSHNVSVRTELQSATDAAALAGADDFLSASTYNSADADALQVASQNNADGRAVSNSSNSTTVTVVSTPPSGTNPGSCQVTAAMQIDNMFSKLFGHNQDTINVTSTADCWTTVNALAANQMFPISPSLDDTSHGAALNTLKIGDPLTLYIEPSGGNAAWTSGTPNLTHPSTPVIIAAAQVALGMAPPNSSANPAMTADGTQQIALTQGLHNGVDLTAPSYTNALINMPYIVLPVMSGSKPYVQSRLLLGFIAMKVSSVSNGAGTLIVSGKLVSTLVKGTGGLLPAGGDANLSVTTVKLVQ